MRTSPLRFAIYLTLIGLCLGLAGPLASQNKKQQEAEALLAKARELSDIRCEGCPPFRLTARVQVFEVRTGSLEGTYMMAWFSPQRWREEISFPGFEQTTLLVEGKMWRRSSLGYEPWRIRQLHLTLSALDKLKDSPVVKVKAIRKKRGRDGARLLCLETRHEKGVPSKFCLDESAGTLASREGGFARYEYSEHLSWTSKWVPGSLRAYQDGKLVLEIRVQEVSAETRTPLEVLNPPSGSEVRVTCQDPDPPVALERKEPGYSVKARRNRVAGNVQVYLVIGVDGKVQHINLIRSLDPDLDKSAIESVRTWKFRPAMCGPDPVQVGVIVETTFKLF